MLNHIFLYILVLCSQSTRLPTANLATQNPLSIEVPNSSTVELTSPLPTLDSKASPLALVHPQQEQSSLWPWLWLSFAAVVGVGSGAYVLRQHDPTRAAHNQRRTVRPLAEPEPSHSAQKSIRTSQSKKHATTRRKEAPTKTTARPVNAPNVSQTLTTYPLAAASAYPPSHKSASLSQAAVGQAYSVEILLNNLQSRDHAIRRQAIWELGQKGESVAVQPLISSMEEADSQQRSLILAALSEIGVRTLTPLNRALGLSLQDKNTDVRKNAIRDITRIYIAMEQISQILGQAIADDDPEVRETAQWALSQVRSPNPIQAIPALPTSVVHHPHQVP